MKAYKNSLRNRFTSAARRAAALLSVLALLTGTFAASGASAAEQRKAEARRLGEEQRVLHALNRLGFGARPGDVERVRKIGLEHYIEQQLHPERIADEVAESKVEKLPVMGMTTAQLYAKYPNPGALLREMQRRGELPADLAALRDNRTKGNNQAPNAGGSAMADDNAAMSGPEKDAAGRPEAAKAENGNEYRKAIREYYMQNGLQQPGKITAELQASRILRAVYSERQLQEVLVDFWTNHFNVFAGKGADRWLLVSYDRDTIRPNTLAKFRDLLQATAESPAMLFYLDNFQSVSPNAQAGNRRRQGQGGLGAIFGQMRRGQRGDGAAGDTNRRQQQPPGDGAMNMPEQRPQQQRPKRGINENYARELMELHTLGVDGGYTQKDVQEVARCFTGWTIFDPRGFASRSMKTLADDAGKFYFNPRLHDDGEKVVLGHKIPAGGGVKDGLMVLDILAKHPSTAKFIATKLARRFVMDNPTPELVARVAAAFTKSDGDIRETLRAVFASPEFNSPASYRAKIKTPFELAITAIRTLGGETNGGPAVHQWIGRMGEPLYQYQAPTGYPDVAEDWVNTGSLLERLNFGLALASNRIQGTRVDLARFIDAGGGAPVDKARVLDRFLDVIVQGDVSPNTKATLLKQMNEPFSQPATEAKTDVVADRPPDGARYGNRRMQRAGVARADLASVRNPEIVKAVGLILGSPEFQRQ